MKKFLFAALFAACFQINPTLAQIPVYVNLGSHNESNDSYDYEFDSADYWLIRGIAQQIADTVTDRQAKWNMQLESNFIRGVLNWEGAAVNMSDFLEATDINPFIEIDPHNHFDSTSNPYNYSDLAFLLNACGLSTRTNLGGFIYRDFPLQGVYEDWMQFQDSVPGYQYQAYRWRPNVIWGAGSPAHSSDFFGYGIWKPKGPTALNFIQHEPANHLTCIGNGCGRDFTLFDTTEASEVLNSVSNAIDYINSNSWPADTFFTLTIMMNFKHFNSPGYVQKVTEIIDGLAHYVSEGKMVWATLTEKYNLWNASHSANDSFLVECADIPIEIAEPLPVTGIEIYPNPSDGCFFIRLESGQEGLLQIFDNCGNQVLTQNLSPGNNHFSTQLPQGLYFSRVFSMGKWTSGKLVIH